MVNLGELVFSIIAEDKASTTVGTAAANIGKAGTTVGTAAANIGKVAQTAGVAMTGIGVGAKVMADNINGTFVPFDKALQGIRSIGASAADVDKIKEASLGISSTMPVAAQDLVDAAYLIRSAGFESLDLTSSFGSGKNALEALAQVAVAGGEDITGVTKTVITAMGAYGETAYSTADIAAVLANGVKLGKFEMGEFGAELQKNIGTAAGLGISLEETASANVILQNSFGSAEEAGTGLKSMLASLIDPAKVGDLEEMGVKVKDSEGNFVGLESVLKQLEPALKKAGGTADQQGALFEIFGSYGVRAAQGLLQNVDALGEYTGTMGDTGAVQEMMNANLESTSAKLEIAGNKAENAKISFGAAMAPATIAAAGAMGGLADIIGGLPGPLQTAAGAVLVGAQSFLAIGPAVAGAGMIMMTFGNGTVQKIIPMLGRVVAGITGGAGLVPAFMAIATGPIGIAIAAIVAIGAAILLLDSQFHFIGGIIEWLGEIWKGFGDWLGDTFGPILEGITGFFGELFGELDGAAGPVEAVLGWFEGLGETLLSVGGYIGGILTPIIQGLASLLGSVLGPYIKYQVEQFTAFAGILYGAVSTAIDVVWNALVGIGTFLMDIFGPAWAALQVVIADAWAAICAIFAPGGPTDLVAIIGEIWTVISTFVPIAWRIIQEAVITAAGAIWNWLSTEGVRLAGEAVAAIWTFITETVPAAWTEITNAVITAAGAIWEWLSTEGVRLAGEAVAAIWTFIVDEIPAAWGIIYAAVKAAAIDIWTWLSTDGLQLAGDAVKAIWDAICTYVPIAWGLIWDALKGVFSMIVGWFSGDANTEANDSVKGIWDAICTYVPIAWEAIKAAVIKWATLIWDWLKTDGKDLAFFALKLIWDVITEYIPTAWDLIKQAVIKAAGIIWNWLSTEGVRLAGEAVAAIWNWVTENVPVAWDLIKQAVIKAAGLIWSWMTTTAPGLAVDAIAAAWSAIARAVPGAWEAIKSAVATAAQNVWDEAQRILKKVFTFELPDIVGAAKRAVEQAQDWIDGHKPSVPTTPADPLVVQPVKPLGGGNAGNPQPFIPSHHSGGLAADEGLALLLKNERVLSPRQTRDYDAGLLDLIRALTRKLDSGGTGGNVIIQGNVGLSADYPYDRLLRDIRRDLAQTRTSRGILS